MEDILRGGGKEDGRSGEGGGKVGKEGKRGWEQGREEKTHGGRGGTGGGDLHAAFEESYRKLSTLLPSNDALDSAAAWTLSEHRDPRTELEFTRHLLHSVLLSLASPIDEVWDPYDVKPQVFALDSFLALPVFTNVKYLRLFCSRFGITVRDPSGVLWAKPVKEEEGQDQEWRRIEARNPHNDNCTSRKDRCGEGNEMKERQQEHYSEEKGREGTERGVNHKGEVKANSGIQLLLPSTSVSAFTPSAPLTSTGPFRNDFPRKGEASSSVCSPAEMACTPPTASSPITSATTRGHPENPTPSHSSCVSQTKRSSEEPIFLYRLPPGHPADPSASASRDKVDASSLESSGAGTMTRSTITITAEELFHEMDFEEESGAKKVKEEVEVEVKVERGGRRETKKEETHSNVFPSSSPLSSKSCLSPWTTRAIARDTTSTTTTSFSSCFSSPPTTSPLLPLVSPLDCAEAMTVTPTPPSPPPSAGVAEKAHERKGKEESEGAKAGRRIISMGKEEDFDRERRGLQEDKPYSLNTAVRGNREKMGNGVGGRRRPTTNHGLPAPLSDLPKGNRTGALCKKKRANKKKEKGRRALYRKDLHQRRTRKEQGHHVPSPFPSPPSYLYHRSGKSQKRRVSKHRRQHRRQSVLFSLRVLHKMRTTLVKRIQRRRAVLASARKQSKEGREPWRETQREKKIFSFPTTTATSTTRQMKGQDEEEVKEKEEDPSKRGAQEEEKEDEEDPRRRWEEIQRQARYAAHLETIRPFRIQHAWPLPTFGRPFLHPFCIGYFADIHTLLHNASILLSRKVDIVLNPGSPIELVLARERMDRVLHGRDGGTPSAGVYSGDDEMAEGGGGGGLEGDSGEGGSTHGHGLLHTAYLRVEQVLRREFLEFFRQYCPEVQQACSACVAVPPQSLEEEEQQEGREADQFFITLEEEAAGDKWEGRQGSSSSCSHPQEKGKRKNMTQRKKKRRMRRKRRGGKSLPSSSTSASSYSDFFPRTEEEGAAPVGDFLHSQRCSQWRAVEERYSGGAAYEVVLLIDSTEEAKTFYTLQKAKHQGKLLGHYSLDIIPMRLAAPHVREMASVFYDKAMEEERRAVVKRQQEEEEQAQYKNWTWDGEGCMNRSTMAMMKRKKNKKNKWGGSNEGEEVENADYNERKSSSGGRCLTGFRQVGRCVRVNPAQGADSFFYDPTNAYTEPHAVFTESLTTGSG